MRAAILLSFVLCLSIPMSAQQSKDLRPTLPELVRRTAPEPVYQIRTSDLVLVALEAVLPEADTVVHGRVGRITSYLSADQRDLYTDYFIEPIRVIKEPPSPKMDRPGQIQPAPRQIIVTRWGGQMTIDGVSVTQEDHDVRAFRPGEEVVLLLAKDKTTGKYRLPSPVGGAFTVEESAVRPLVRNLAEDPIFERFRGMTVSAFDAEVQRLSR